MKHEQAGGQPRAAHRASVLVVDADEAFHSIARRYLAKFRLLTADSAWRATELLRTHHVDLVLLDLGVPDAAGTMMIEEFMAGRRDIEVIAMGPAGALELAVDAVKRGAFDFFAKGHRAYERLPQLAERALAHRRRRLDAYEAETRDAWLGEAFDLLERSEVPCVRAMVAAARRLANTPIVLLRGEEGSGKELLARYIHALSDRAHDRFVSAAIPAIAPAHIVTALYGYPPGTFVDGDDRPGKFELAEGGTLFIGGIAALCPAAQRKLTTTLRTGEVVVSGCEPRPLTSAVIASTSKDLRDEVSRDKFNPDLLDMLEESVIDVPPLRERAADVPELAGMLARKHALAMRRPPPRFSTEALSVLKNSDWPGNVRELDGLAMRLVATHGGGLVGFDDLPPEYCVADLQRAAARAGAEGRTADTAARPYFLARDQFERYLVRLMVRRCKGNKRAAARVLGVSYSTVKQKLREQS